MKDDSRNPGPNQDCRRDAEGPIGQLHNLSSLVLTPTRQWRLFNIDPESVGGLAVCGDDDIDIAAPGQDSWHTQVDLIQAEQAFQRSGDGDLGVHASDLSRHGRERAAIADAGSARNEEDL